jgi:hypothetical protein
MVRRPDLTAALCLLLLSGLGLAQTMLPADPSRSVRISGRVVSPDGQPSNFGVGVGEIVPDGLRDWTQLSPDPSTGVFTFYGRPGTKYRFFLGAAYSTPRITADTASGKDVDLGDIVWRNSCPVGAPQPRQVPEPSVSARRLLDEMIIEPQTPPLPRGVYSDGTTVRVGSPLALPPSSYRDSSGMTAADSRVIPDLPPCWRGPSLDRPDEWRASGMVEFFSHPFRLESFVGMDGKVRSLRVVRYIPGHTETEIREEVGKIWLGGFSEVMGSITWSEGNFWNVEVSVEYDDGKRTAFLTDGAHVEVEDRQGKYWFMLH